MAWVEILNEVPTVREADWTLCFHWCRYHYDDGTTDTGYRFIWRRPNGNLQAARGQARIGSAEDIRNLIQLATNEGWYENVENL